MDRIPPDLPAFMAQARSERGHTRKIIQGLRRQKPKQLDQHFQRAHQEAFACLDCLECANCCNTTGPRFTPADIDRLAPRFKLSTRAFINRYLRRDEDGDYVAQQLPCPFLGADNYCSVYAARPEACADFPHTHRRKMHRHLRITAQNAEICPAVYRITRQLEENLLS